MANSFANTDWDFYNVRFDLAPWRVLGKDKCGGQSPPQPSTRHPKNYGKNQTESRGGAEPSPLNRLGIGCRFFRRAWLSTLWFSFSAFCCSLAVALAAFAGKQAFSIPPHCLFGWLRVA